MPVTASSRHAMRAWPHTSKTTPTGMTHHPAAVGSGASQTGSAQPGAPPTRHAPDHTSPHARTSIAKDHNSPEQNHHSPGDEAYITVQTYASRNSRCVSETYVSAAGTENASVPKSSPMNPNQTKKRGLEIVRPMPHNTHRHKSSRPNPQSRRAPNPDPPQPRPSSLSMAVGGSVAHGHTKRRIDCTLRDYAAL